MMSLEQTDKVNSKVPNPTNVGGPIKFAGWNGYTSHTDGAG